MNDLQNISWQQIVAKYHPHRGRSIWQLVNTLTPYAGLWCLMAWSIHVSYGLTLALSVIAAGFLVRIFIIFHDCGHGSFFKSKKVNSFWGYMTGVLTFTPSAFWRHEHAIHHSHSGDLDKRGVGEVWTMTVQEYINAPRWTKIKYRLARNPFCLFIISPAILFLIIHRLPWGKFGSQGSKSVHLTNIGILIMAVAMSSLIGLKTYLLIQLPVLIIAASAGVWLFYVQHQFEGAYWDRDEKWDYVAAALKGSSFYRLPKVLQWFTGSIGFHHIHHLSPRIPNYYLEKCYQENSLFQQIQPITLLASFKSLKFRLWDEEHHQLVGFDYLKNSKV
jgi:omega-6 fatty acid desaturase (delta-12 desaturase)